MGENLHSDQLISLSLEAIGGEMEGAGLYAAAQRKKVDWILVPDILSLDKSLSFPPS